MLASRASHALGLSRGSHSKGREEATGEVGHGSGGGGGGPGARQHGAKERERTPNHCTNLARLKNKRRSYWNELEEHERTYVKGLALFVRINVAVIQTKEVAELFLVIKPQPNLFPHFAHRSFIVCLALVLPAARKCDLSAPPVIRVGGPTHEEELKVTADDPILHHPLLPVNRGLRRARTDGVGRLGRRRGEMRVGWRRRRSSSSNSGCMVRIR